ncbi:MAG TPA: acetyltransferase, partial [Rhizobiales bacterium]|nr:acetyltransferase [Hyphomicrobiales bacterium]
MSKTVYIVGAGGHARVVLEALLQAGREVGGIIDRDESLWGREFCGVRVLGNDDVLREMGPENIELANGVGAAARYNDAGLEARARVFDAFRKDGFRFATVYGKNCTIASDAVIGQGSQIMAGSVIQPGVVIGENVIVNTGAAVDHDCRIASHVHIAPGACLCGNVVVDELSFIGAGAVIIQGNHIGRQALVAAGAVVSRPVD